MSGGPPAQIRKGGLAIRVRLTPKSSKSAVEGVELFGNEPCLKVRVTAAPEDGKANDALLAALAAWLDMPKSALSLAAGAKSRIKTVNVAGDSQALLQRVSSLLKPGNA